MDYQEWVKDLHNRGFKTTSLSGNEANFADYANALSAEIKAKVGQNGKTQADKDVQALVASLYGKKSNMPTSELISLCKAKGLKVQCHREKTTYIVDEKATGKKGQKKVIKGSINIITITDPRTGGKLVIADANGNAAIEIEEIFLNEILSGVTSDIQAGAGAGGADGSNNGLEAQKYAAEEEIERLKKENAEVAKQIEELEVQAKKEIEEAEAEIERIQAALREEIDKITADMAALYQANPDKYTKERIDRMISSKSGSKVASANAQIAVQEAKINNNNYIAQIDKLVANASTIETKIAAENTKLASFDSAQVPKALDSNGYAVQQTGKKDILPQTQQYNEMVTNLRKDYAYANKTSSLVRMQIENDATAKKVSAKSYTETISDKQAAKEAEEQKKRPEEEQKTA